jgi:hypothetical protein
VHLEAEFYESKLVVVKEQDEMQNFNAATIDRHIRNVVDVEIEPSGWAPLRVRWTQDQLERHGDHHRRCWWHNRASRAPVCRVRGGRSGCSSTGVSVTTSTWRKGLWLATHLGCVTARRSLAALQSLFGISDKIKQVRFQNAEYAAAGRTSSSLSENAETHKAPRKASITTAANSTS